MLSENIKNARKAKGLSQEELAKELNVVRQTISKWEKRLSVPDAEMIVKIARVLDTTVGTLLDQKSDNGNAEIERLSAELAALNLKIAEKNESTRKKRHSIFAVVFLFSFCIFAYRIFNVLFSPIDDVSLYILGITHSVLQSSILMAVSFMGFYKTRKKDNEPIKPFNKNLKNVCLFLLNLLPLTCCAIFKGGILADVLAITFMLLPLYTNFKYSSKLYILILQDLVLLFSTSAAIYFIIQLYLKYVSDDSDYGTLIIGNLVHGASLIIFFVISSITIVLKINHKQKL